MHVLQKKSAFELVRPLVSLLMTVGSTFHRQYATSAVHTPSTSFRVDGYAEMSTCCGLAFDDTLLTDSPSTTRSVDINCQRRQLGTRPQRCHCHPVDNG